MSKIVLIDGHAVLHRAYHALPPLTSKVGQVNAVYGFVSMLFRLISDLRSTHIAVCLDRKEKTFRKEIYESYQAQRPEADKEFISQIDIAKEVIESFGIPIFSVAGFEADDVIGTLAEKAHKGGFEEIIIVTGDRDILQLVDDAKKIRVYLMEKGVTQSRIYEEKDVKEKLGILPSLIPDYKALVGDSSDNYPGVKGIGPKTAVLLLSEYGSLDGIYLAIDKIPSRIAKILIEGKKDSELSYKLAKIEKNIPLEVDFDDLKRWQVDRPAVFDTFEKIGFKSLAKRAKELGKVFVSENQGKLF